MQNSGQLKTSLPVLLNDVRAFQAKFGIPMPERPAHPDPDLLQLKLVHLQEELDEIIQAAEGSDLVNLLDGIVDLIYVALGFALSCGLPFHEAWNEVHSANMRKVRAERPSDSKRGSGYDVVKPAGWTAPDIQGVLNRAY